MSMGKANELPPRPPSRLFIVRIVVNSLTFDGATKDPMQKAVRDALIAFMAATAEAQAEATREAQKAGIAHAKATEPHSYRGTKPSCDRAQLDIIRDMIAQDASPTASGGLAAGCLPGAGRSAKAEAMLAEWGL
jgi:putative DNA-invertase from lambdoid prophage Rac